MRKRYHYQNIEVSLRKFRMHSKRASKTQCYAMQFANTMSDITLNVTSIITRGVGANVQTDVGLTSSATRNYEQFRAHWFRSYGPGRYYFEHATRRIEKDFVQQKKRAVDADEQNIYKKNCYNIVLFLFRL